MIRYFKHKDIDKTKWDHCIENASNGFVYALSWYLDIVSPNWDALIEGDYEIVMPLPIRKKIGLKYLIRPYFVQQLGIFGNSLNTTKIDEFILLVKRKFLYSNFNLNFLNISPILSDKEKGITYKLALNKSYEELSIQFHQNTTRNIKKASSSHLKIINSQDPEPLFNLYKNSGKFFEGERFWNCLVEITQRTLEKTKSEISYAYIGNEIYCAILWVNWGNRVLYLISCSSDEGKALNASTLLINEFIKTHSNSELILDFEGSKISGLARYYKGFGSEQEEFPSLHFNNLFWLFNFH